MATMHLVPKVWVTALIASAFQVYGQTPTCQPCLAKTSYAIWNTKRPWSIARWCPSRDYYLCSSSSHTQWRKVSGLHQSHCPQQAREDFPPGSPKAAEVVCVVTFSKWLANLFKHNMKGCSICWDNCLHCPGLRGEVHQAEMWAEAHWLRKP